MFNINSEKGFQITFENGWTVSVQFGPGNYCHNQDHEMGPTKLNYDKAKPDCPNAEVAAFASHDHWYTFSKDKNDTVKGWVTPEELVEFLQMVKEFKRAIPKKSNVGDKK
jgi:hypothetical protein